MTTVRWQAITSGETFQAFAAQLLLNVDPSTLVFTWPGPDGGQDARSRDGTIAYQAKHHSRAEARHPREDALAELGQIREYRKPSHARHAQWAAVTRWVLLTNVATQTTETDRWAAEVVPAFRAEGIEPELWAAERLEKHIAEFPALGGAFFEGATRAFVSLGEAVRRVVGLDPATHGGRLPKLRGRDAFVSSILSQFASHRIVALVAPEGVGATRVALAAAVGAVDAGVVPAAYFTNPTNLAVDTHWYSAFVPEHPMLVVLDDLDDADGVRTIRRITEEMNGRAASWKILIVTAPHQTAIHAAMRRAPGLAPAMELGGLSREDTAALVDEVVRQHLPPESAVDSTELDRVARAIATHVAGLPLWAVVSALTLAEGRVLGTVPASRREHVRDLLRALPSRVSLHAAEQRLVVPTIRAVATLGTVDLHDSASASWAPELAGGITADELHQTFEALEHLHVMRRWGVARRLWSVTPAVLSDAVVTEWLTAQSGRVDAAPGATALARMLREAVRAGDVPRPAIAALRTLARAGFVGRDEAAAAREAVRDVFREMRARANNAEDLVRGIDVAEEVAHWMPQVAVDLALDVLRPRAESDDAVGRARRRVPWLLFHAAGGARTPDERTELVRALFRAAQHEAAASPPAHPDDGKSAQRVIARIVESIDEVADFSAEFEALVHAQLDGHAPAPTALVATEWVLRPLVHIEGMTSRYDAKTYQFRHYRIHPASARARVRRRLLDRLWGMLERDFDGPWRVVAWRVLHVSRSAMMFGSNDAADRARVHLERALPILSTHPALGLDEVRAARESWSWHLEFGEASEEKQLAERCEEHYQRIVRQDRATTILLGTSFDAELEPTRTGSVGEVVLVFDQILAAAVRIGTDHAWLRARRVSDAVGRSGRAECREALFDLATHAHAGAAQASVIVEFVGGLLSAARALGGDAVAALWRDIDARAPGLSVRARASLYGERFAAPAGLLQEDFTAFAARLDALAATSPIETFHALGRMLWLGNAVRGAVARAWSATADARRARAFIALVEGAHAVLGAQLVLPVPALSEWVLDQLLEVPRPDDVFGETGNWYLDQILAMCGRPPPRGSPSSFGSAPPATRDSATSTTRCRTRRRFTISSTSTSPTPWCSRTCSDWSSPRLFVLSGWCTSILREPRSCRLSRGPSTELAQTGASSHAPRSGRPATRRTVRSGVGSPCAPSPRRPNTRQTSASTSTGS